MDKRYYGIIALLGLLVITHIAFITNKPEKEVPVTPKKSEVLKYEGKKIVYVNSYDSNYYWSKGIEDAIINTFKKSGIELTKYYMNTKTVDLSKEYARDEGVKVQELINSLKPDVVIVSDDNAYKYVVIDSINGATPYVFCGVNYHATGIDTTTTNVTGMLEVELTNKLYNQLVKYGKGKRFGFIGENVVSNIKRLEYTKNYHNIKVRKSYLVHSLDEWKKKFVRIQKEVDILYVASFQSLPGYDKEEMKKFVEENTKIPTGSTFDYLSDFALVNYAKESSEQGMWAAETALRILDGEEPRKIEVTRNRKAKIILNTEIAQRLGVEFSIEMIRNAHLVSQEY